MYRSRHCPTRAMSIVFVLSLTLARLPRLSGQTPAPTDVEDSSPPARTSTQTVDLLEASKARRLNVTARGQGQDRVRLTIRNPSHTRLNVVLSPGLVAASAAGQRGGGGMQSVGLGMFSNRPGTFGQFRDTRTADGLRSVGVDPISKDTSLTVPADESVDLVVPGVCMNYGLPAPTPRDSLTLMDVDSYTTDSRVRTALRSLGSLGTSQGVAQAVMWRVCDDLPFETMAAQAGKVLNEPEIALAARFVDALDASEATGQVEPRLLEDRRIFVRIQGEPSLASEARRLNDQLQGERLLGLPVSVADGEELPEVSAPALFVRLVLVATTAGDTRGRIVVGYAASADQWRPFGKLAFQVGSSLDVLDGKSLAAAIDRTISLAFVTVRPAKRSVGSTTMRIENHLPFTLAHVTLRAGNSAGAPTVPFRGVGVGPARSTLVPIQAATAVVERVELNGL